MESLPYFVKDCRNTWPDERHYLSAEQELVAYWRQRLSDKNNFCVAIYWEGNPKTDKKRDIPLPMFGLLASVPGVKFWSLQQGKATLNIRKQNWRHLIEDLGPQIDQSDAFVDSAAILRNADLLISSDTGMAHLAGALGTPVWILLRKLPDFRWLKADAEQSLYPSMRTFRQNDEGDWHSVMAEVGRELGILVHKSRIGLKKA